MIRRRGNRLISRRALLTLDVDRPAPAARWLRVSRTAMACRFDVTLPASAARHIDAARAALDEAERLEAALSVFRSSSELSRINRGAAASTVAATEDLFALLRRCEALHAATGGAFDITSTPLSRCWGFLERKGRVPSAGDIEAARRRVGMNRVRLDADTRTVRFADPGIELSLGSIGKGYAVDRLAALLRRRGVTRALVSSRRQQHRGHRWRGRRLDDRCHLPAAQPATGEATSA
jgi:thiamine biosynthesis lipoprotein